MIPHSPLVGGVRKLIRVIDIASLAGGVVAAVALALLTIIILLEVGVRLLSGFIAGLPAGMPGAWENSAYLMGTAFMAGAAMTLRAGSHIRVSVLLGQVPAGARSVLELVSTVMGLALTGFLAWSMVLFTMASYNRGQTSIASDTPIWIPEAAITLGCLLLALQMFGRLLAIVAGEPTELAHLKASAAE